MPTTACRIILPGNPQNLFSFHVIPEDLSAFHVYIDSLKQLYLSKVYD